MRSVYNHQRLFSEPPFPQEENIDIVSNIKQKASNNVMHVKKKKEKKRKTNKQTPPKKTKQNKNKNKPTNQPNWLYLTKSRSQLNRVKKSTVVTATNKTSPKLSLWIR